MKSRTQSSAAAVQQLPKGTIARVSLGSSFAEYDRTLMKAGVFVETPAFRAAVDQAHGKSFFIGRRGSGKTAITYYLLQRDQRNTLQLLPQIFSSLSDYFDFDGSKPLRQRCFRSLVACFKRAMEDEVIGYWMRRGHFSFTHAPTVLTKERKFIEDCDFDLRLTMFVERSLLLLEQKNEREWLREIKRTKEIGSVMNDLREDRRYDFTVIIDRVDEEWDGSTKAVVLLTALMHACIEIAAASNCVRPLLFLRENMFERVRDYDTEFTRLETAVVSIEWSRELLLELIERRLNLALTAKLPLHGPTWDCFFERVDDHSSQDYVFDYCHYRPRDVLTYCSLAVESAQSHRHHHISVEDLLTARRQFSENRLKDLGDEYAENYPQIQLVLGRFFGLGCKFTINGVAGLIKKLLVDDEVKRFCGEWIFRYTAPERFIKLFYDIGFMGIQVSDTVQYRTSGPQPTATPPITSSAVITIHPSYIEALSLQNKVVGSLEDSVELRTSGLLVDLPEAIDLEEYHRRLSELMEELKTLPCGDSSAAEFERIVGDVVKLCFFRSLSNVQPHVRSIDGRVIRDWIAANHATGGFWEMVRLRYGATQIIWECKNYSDLGADAFHQAAYYMTREIGRFTILLFRGDVKPHYYEHIKRISAEKDGGLLLLLSDRDLLVFLRQALKGKNREQHIEEVFDRTVRSIS